jgi:hypothetical protein
MKNRTKQKLSNRIIRASQVIMAENKRRREHNAKREKLLGKGKAAPEALPMLRPPFVPLWRLRAKQLPGYYGTLLNILRKAGTPIPTGRWSRA